MLWQGGGLAGRSGKKSGLAKSSGKGGGPAKLSVVLPSAVARKAV